MMIGVGLIALARAASAGSPVPVTTCGQTVTGTGQLVTNLDCSGTADDAVKLSGKLLLNGFTLTGNPAFDVVRCAVGACRVSGPGTVTGGSAGVRSKSRAKILRSTVSGNGGDGVRADGSASIKESTVTGNAGAGVDSDRTAKAKLSTVTANGLDGMKGLRVALSSSTATGNGTDPSCGVTDDCADLAAATLPRVTATSACDTSRDTENGGTWGVCAND